MPAQQLLSVVLPEIKSMYVWQQLPEGLANPKDNGQA